MSEKVFDRETLLDLTVNVIPLGILAFFFVAYIVFTPFGFDSVLSAIQLGIIGLSAVGLAALTYYSGAAVSKAETEEERAHAEAESELDEESEPELDAGDEE